MALQAGSATRIVNSEIGDDLRGQLHRRLCERIRDNLEANLLYLADDNERLLLASLDLCGLEIADIRPAQADIEARTGIPARNVLLSCTHTHTGPQTNIGFDGEAPKNEPYVRRLHAALVDAAQEAVATARPARIGSASGRAHVGFNRRLCWADGSHSMYGDSTRPDFTGLEGPDDPAHAVLFALDDDARPVAVVHNNCSHATCVEGALFASADFPGEARARLRDALGPALPVLYLQGASGDTSPWNMLASPPRYDGEQRLKEVGGLLAHETINLIREAKTTAEPVLRHAFDELTLAVRLPTVAELDRAQEIKALGEHRAGRWDYVLAVHGVLRLQEQFGADPVDTVPLHALRVGDFALATNPCELYCQFGLDIKRRSPAAVTAVAQLTDGSVGYCPTIHALLGGGYSGMAIEWCRLEPYAGYKIVDASARMLHALWNRR